MTTQTDTLDAVLAKAKLARAAIDDASLATRSALDAIDYAAETADGHEAALDALAELTSEFANHDVDAIDAAIASLTAAIDDIKESL